MMGEVTTPSIMADFTKRTVNSIILVTKDMNKWWLNQQIRECEHHNHCFLCGKPVNFLADLRFNYQHTCGLHTVINTWPFNHHNVGLCTGCTSQECWNVQGDLGLYKQYMGIYFNLTGEINWYERDGETKKIGVIIGLLWLLTTNEHWTRLNNHWRDGKLGTVG